mmetsp:Transcript_21635/g.56450  ORF Transcript_21635/g.56450 Transcript_21635/m.56450 type:complete len:232 (-) Transcript_21635:75-770(-)
MDKGRPDRGRHRRGGLARSAVLLRLLALRYAVRRCFRMHWRHHQPWRPVGRGRRAVQPVAGSAQLRRGHLGVHHADGAGPRQVHAPAAEPRPGVVGRQHVLRRPGALGGHLAARAGHRPQHWSRALQQPAGGRGQRCLRRRGRQLPPEHVQRDEKRRRIPRGGICCSEPGPRPRLHRPSRFRCASGRRGLSGPRPQPGKRMDGRAEGRSREVNRMINSECMDTGSMTLKPA